MWSSPVTNDRKARSTVCQPTLLRDEALENGMSCAEGSVHQQPRAEKWTSTIFIARPPLCRGGWARRNKHWLSSPSLQWTSFLNVWDAPKSVGCCRLEAGGQHSWVIVVGKTVLWPSLPIFHTHLWGGDEVLSEYRKSRWSPECMCIGWHGHSLVKDPIEWYNLPLGWCSEECKAFLWSKCKCWWCIQMLTFTSSWPACAN